MFGCEGKKSSSDGGGEVVEGVVAGGQPDDLSESGAGRSMSSILLPASLQNLPAKTSNATAISVRVVGNGLQFFSFVVRSDADSCDGAVYGDPLAPETVISADLGADGPKVLCVLATGTDTNGKLQIAPFQYIWFKDTVAPSLSVQTPSGFGPYFSASPDFSLPLNFSDAGTGLHRAAVSVQQIGGSCLNTSKSGFDSPCPTFIQLEASTGTPVLGFAKSLLVVGASYDFSLEAEDRATNTASLNAAWTPVWDGTPPVAPASMTATAGKRLVNLSWSNVTGAANYLVIRRQNAPVVHTPISGNTYSSGVALDSAQVVVGVFAGTSTVNQGLVAFTNYYYKVFAIDAAGNIETSGATSAAQPDDVTEFRGLTHAYVWGPGRRIAAEWQPFADAQTSYSQMDYGLFLSETSGGQNFSGNANTSVTNTSGVKFTDVGTNESIFLAARSRRLSGEQDSNAKELRLRFGPGYHNKIGAATRTLGADPLAQTFIRNAQTVKLDSGGNVLFTSGAGLVSVLCRENTLAFYCLGRTLNRTYTIAGRDGMEDGEDEFLASSTAIGDIFSISVGSSGNVYLADGTYFRVRAICYNPLASGFCNGKKQAFMYRFTGTGVAADGANNFLTSGSSVGTVYGLDADTAGNVIMADSQYFKVRIACVNNEALCVGKTPGNSYTLVGTGLTGDSGDDVNPTSSAIGGPRGLKVSNTNNIYISDFDYRRVRILCSTVSGTSEFCSGKTAGRLYRAMGTGASVDGADNISALTAGIGQSFEVATSDANNLFISDSTYRRIRVICYNTTATGACFGRTVGNVYWVAGTGILGDGVNGSLALSSTLGDVRGLTVTGEGNILVSDFTYRRLRLICTNSSANSICDSKFDEYQYHLVGTGASVAGWQSSAIATPLGTPVATAVDSIGNYWFGDGVTPMIRVICYAVNSGGYCQGKTAGVAYIAAGTGVAGDGLDGLAIASAMGVPVGLAVDSSGNAFVADSAYRRIRALCFNVAATGFCNGKSYGNSYRFVGDAVAAADTANAVAASLTTGIIGGVALDSTGNLFYIDTSYFRIRAVCQNTTGYCTGKTVGFTYRVAGTGVTGDGANNAAMGTTAMGVGVSITLDSFNNVFVGDTTTFKIRAYCLNTAGGYCSGRTAGNTFRITGGAGVAFDTLNDSVASGAGLGIPNGIAFDGAGNLYVADASFRRIRVICLENSAAGPCLGSTIGNSFRLYGNGLVTGDPASGYHGASIRLDTPSRGAIDFDLSGNMIYSGSSGAVRMFSGY